MSFATKGFTPAPEPTYRTLGKVPMTPPTRLLPSKPAAITVSPAAQVAALKVNHAALFAAPPAAITAKPAVSTAAHLAAAAVQQSPTQLKKNSAAIVASAKEKKKGDLSGYIPPSPFGPGTGGAPSQPATQPAAKDDYGQPATTDYGQPATSQSDTQPTAKDYQPAAYPYQDAPLPSSSTVPDDASQKTESASSEREQAIPTVKTTTVLAPGLWDRFLSFLGLARKTIEVPASIHGETNSESVKEAAESVVRRVRSGDQNAMALMAMVRDNAAAGNVRAKNSLRYMKMYIDKYPVGGASMGNEHDEAIRLELGE
jgi:hypothetical protein